MLFVLSSLTESENCGDEVVENGGVQCLLEVIELFSNEREVMIPLCQLVKAVASNPGAKATMIKEDVVSTLVTVITAGEKEDAELIGADGIGECSIHGQESGGNRYSYVAGQCFPGGSGSRDKCNRCGLRGVYGEYSCPV